MTTKDEVLKQALEALESVGVCFVGRGFCRACRAEIMRRSNPRKR